MIPSEEVPEQIWPSSSDENLQDPSVSDRQSKYSEKVKYGWRSPTVLGMHGTGWFLLLCMFLPVARGCNDNVLRPIEMVQISTATSWEDVSSGILVLFTYSNGAIVAGSLAIVALFRSPKIAWRIFQWHFGFTVLISSLLSLSIAFSKPGTRDQILGLLYFVPPITAVLFWISLAAWRGQRSQAWARLQHGWTIACFCILHLQCVFVNAWLYGYFMTLAALGFTVVMVEIAKNRMAHDLWDATLPVTKPRFSISAILIWTTVLASMIAYFQSIEKLVEYFYPA